MTDWTAALDGATASGPLPPGFGPRAASLARMHALGLPVPAGFAVSAAACRALAVGDGEAAGAVQAALETLGTRTGRRLDDPAAPLLVAVQPDRVLTAEGLRAGILNLGLTGAVADGLAAAGLGRLAADSRRRLVARWAEAVLGLDRAPFDDILDMLVERHGDFDAEVSDEDLAEAMRGSEAMLAEMGGSLPATAAEQIHRAILAVAAAEGTGVVVQRMAFGNRDRESGTGRLVTRNVKTGEPGATGSFVAGVQGADAFSGLRLPQALGAAERLAQRATALSLEEAIPEGFSALMAAATALERAERDCQEIVFVIEAGTPWLVSTRPAARSGKAALRIAVDLVAEGLIDRREALMRIAPGELEPLLHPALEAGALTPEIARGLPASPGAAWGEIVLTAAEAEAAKAMGRPVILVRQETGPEDVRGMMASEGILTRLGGMTSHAAVVARGWGKPCVSGASALRVDIAGGTVTVGGRTLRRGDTITLDGGSGRVLLGRAPMREPVLTDAFRVLMGWADEVRRLGVRANAETAADAATALALGAEGVGLCRTEHMFFEEGRIVAVREMILAADPAARAAALERLKPMQRQDFAALFRSMPGLPVTVRLLDPPLHEFLPRTEAETAEVAAALGLSTATLRARVAELAEVNPMLGLRGCRLALLYPEIPAMQVRALMEAAADVSAETGAPVPLEIMVPLVSTRIELDRLAAQIEAIAGEVRAARGLPLPYRLGTMIEVPRAALRAGELAETAAFFSFGTNDLTQTAWGISRDDSAALLDTYLAEGLLAADPFVTLDQDGVGELIRLAAERGRASRPDLKLGLCGEHGGDPASVAFCDAAGLDYVSCAPRRVPIARLAAAQAALSRSSS